MYKHGPPSSLSVDHELNRGPMKTFLLTQKIRFNLHPARRHNKISHIERRYATLRKILEKLNRDRSGEDSSELVSCGTFLRNLFSGSKLASCFEQVRAYTSAVLGLPQSFVPRQLLDAHKEQKDARALESTLRARQPHTVPKTSLPPGSEIWFFHRSSNNNEPNRWLRPKVIKATGHIIYARRT